MPESGWSVPNGGMHLIAASLNSPQTTTYLVIGLASLTTVAFLVRFWFAWRSNARLAAAMGGFTPTESSLARSHAALIIFGVLASMGLAVGAVLVPAVREFLAAVGERGRWVRIVPIPFGTLYLLWLRSRIRRSARERAARAS
jgi:hypothetical protein